MTNEPAIEMTAPPNVYRQRRARLAAAIRRPLVIFAGHAPARNYPTNPHPFRAGSSYLYFGGPPLENAALLIEPRGDGDNGCTLLRPPIGPDDALWFGEVPSDEALGEAAGLRRDGVADSDRLGALLAGRQAASVVPPYPDTLAWAAQLGLAKADDHELLAIIHQRLIKDEHELAAMRRAAEICMEGHRAALAATGRGQREADLAAAFVAVLVANGCEPSFNPIITVRGEVLHGHGHPNLMPNGALLLCDAGPEEPGGYASDITRTWPVSGKWTPIQRHLYDTTLRALREATAACAPGKRYRDVHDLSARVICEGLVEAELLRGDPAELVARTAHALFYPHGVGHLIGLDAHDMEDFGDLAGYAPGRARRPEFGNKSLRLDRDLQPGMAVTIEPGIYLVPAIWARDDLVKPLAEVVNRPKVDALLKDHIGGIRLEDTICVRDTGGPEVLSEDLPTDADEIAACVGFNR
ncbi:MAG TPA: aminopeptidase P N-terminal domain-containing protein [Phycisphaerae bacterium]|nr:aminopeptidase P N-terminal domain-containing protein [Phycisphaerae bacterium]